MSQEWAALSGTRRAFNKRIYARDRATEDYVCPKCSAPIDWYLPYKDPDTEQVNVWSKSVDHITELQDGGAILDIDNATTVHLHCNTSKGAARMHARRQQTRTTIIHIDPHTL